MEKYIIVISLLMDNLVFEYKNSKLHTNEQQSYPWNHNLCLLMTIFPRKVQICRLKKNDYQIIFFEHDYMTDLSRMIWIWVCDFAFHISIRTIVSVKVSWMNFKRLRYNKAIVIEQWTTGTVSFKSHSWTLILWSSLTFQSWNVSCYQIVVISFILSYGAQQLSASYYTSSHKSAADMHEKHS